MIICGIATNVCIETSVRDGFCRGFKIIEVSDCMAARTEDAHRAYLENTEALFAEVTDS